MKVQPTHMWRNDITGLRALAVLPVLLFHAFPNSIQGGFFGVDIFFVISGYLISGIIFRGLQANSFSYLEFYDKRIRRIIPNLLLVFAFIVVLGLVIMTGDEFEKLGKHLQSSAAFIQNFRLLKGDGYFAGSSAHNALLHLWSLAIEEQFYIVFPILCTLLWKGSRSKEWMGGIVSFIVIGSLGWCLVSSNKDWAFYFPLTRFWELGGGIVLAYLEFFLRFDFRKVDRFIRSALSCLSLVGIVAAMVFYTKEMFHPGWITLFPVLGAMGLIVASPDAIVNRTLLCWRPMTFVGLISYSLYLWHWPVLVFLAIACPGHSLWWNGIALVASFLVATAVYKYVELPARRCKFTGRIPVSACLMVGLCLTYGVGLFLRLSEGIPNRPMLPGVKVLASLGDGVGTSFRKQTHPYDYRGLKIAVTNPKTFPSVVIFGDSHAEQYVGRAKILSDRTGVNIGFVTYPGCYVLGELNEKGISKRCMNQRILAREVLKDSRLKTVVLAQIWGANNKYYDQSKVWSDLKSWVEASPERKVVVLLDPPWSAKMDVKSKVNRLFYDLTALPIEYDKSGPWIDGNRWIANAISPWGAIIDPTPYVCPKGVCDLLQWYRDDDHLSLEAVARRGVWFDGIVK